MTMAAKVRAHERWVAEILTIDIFQDLASFGLLEVDPFAVGRGIGSVGLADEDSARVAV